MSQDCLFRSELCLARLEAADAEAAIRAVAAPMAAAGLVRPTFAEAVLGREQSAPTGLPMPRRKVAIPHTDPEHVIAPCAGVAALVDPVTFAEMGNPGASLDVDLVVVLALTERSALQHELVRLVSLFQDPAFLDRLHEAADGLAMHALLCGEQR